MARARIMGGKLNKTVAERKAYWQTQINPQTGEFFTDDEADVLALNDANTVWKAKLSGTQANTARNVAAAGGLTPIQPAQAAAQQLQIATTRGTIKGALRTATQLMTQSLSKAEQAEANTKNYYEKTIQKQKDAMRNYLIGIKQNPDAPDQSVIGVDKDYQKMNKAHDEMIIEYNRLKQISDTARATYEGHATAKQAAQDQLDSFEEEIKNLGVTGVPQGVQNTPVGGLQVISQRPDVKAKLKQYRDLHPEDKRNDFTVIQGMIAHKIITP
jgi:hypothetical protein